MPMTGRILAALSLIALLALAGCGGGGGGYTTTSSTETTATTQTTETTPPETTSLRVYVLLDGKVQPVSREVPKTQAVARAALKQLLAGPTTANRELGMTTGFHQGVRVLSVDIANSVASVALDGSYERAGVAQLVYTLTQFPTVKAVEIGGKRYTRADFEDFTPIILVESPLPFETVTNPFRVTGTANTFEATFQYEVVDPNGNVVAKNFVTATSGSGQRGTFDFVTKKFNSPAGTGALVVFEISAKDGSRVHEVRIPVQLPG
jgi:hypothetical protein